MIQINQQLDVDAMIEDIEFAKCISLPDNSMMGGVEHGIPLNRLYDILHNYFLQIKDYLNAETTTNNSRQLASTSTTTF